MADFFGIPLPADTTLPVAAILAFFLSIFGWRTLKVFMLVLRGKPRGIFTWNLLSWSELTERVKSLLVYGIAQRRMFRESYGGILHAFIFFGFLVLGVTVVEFVGEGLMGPGWKLPVVGHNRYLFLFVDLFVAFVFIGCVMAAARRLIVRPAKLKGSNVDGMIVLSFIITIVVTLAVVTASRMALAGFPEEARWTPVSWELGVAMARTGWTPEMFTTAEHAAWWTHLFALFGFLAFLPFSKHFHVVTSLPNVFFRSLEPTGRMRPLDLQAAGADDRFGASRPEEFPWKDLLDSFSCTECGRCTEQCPAYATGKPLNPRKIVTDLRENLLESAGSILGGNGNGHRPALIGPGFTTEDELWSCTTCAACVEACPLFIDQMGKILEERRHLVMMQGSMPAEAQGALRNIEVNGSPWSFSPQDRANWADGLDVPRMADVGDASKVEVLYWVGCAASYDDRNKAVARSVVKVLKAAGVKFAILGPEERCTGDPARRMGNEYLAQTYIRQNAATLNKYRVHTVITACPHCFNSFKNEYPVFGFNARVIHHGEFIAELLKEGRLKLTKKLDGHATYHDSCYLGRYNKIYDPQREVIKATGLTLVEMTRVKDKGFCCGAGGARFLMEERLGSRINNNRVNEAVDTRANILASACPYCMTMMEDGTKAVGVRETLVPKDIAELVAEAL
ncbi:MAG: heterodisulfide reductase-related iron-sulfur binding cluster [Halobacteria archaeon]